jgi:hypothetical protein
MKFQMTRKGNLKIPLRRGKRLFGKNIATREYCIISLTWLVEPSNGKRGDE